MLTIPASIIVEKNKLYSGEAVVELLEWQISETGVTVRIANYNENIRWGNRTWLKFRFEGGGETDSGGDSAEVIQVKVSGVDRAIQEYLDSLTNGGIGDTVIYRRVHTSDLDALATLTAEFEIVDIDVGPDTEWVIFNLGQQNFFLSQFPGSVYRRDVCRYRPTLTAVCPYVNDSSCARTFANCIFLGQQAVFGGQPGLPGAGIPGGSFNVSIAAVAAYGIPAPIEATRAGIVVAGHNPIVVLSGNINATKTTVTVAGHSATITTALTLTTTKAAVTVAGHNADIASGVNYVNATKAEIAVAGHNPTLKTDISFGTTKAGIVVVGNNPIVVVGSDINATTGRITVAGHDATITTANDINATKAEVIVAGHSPNVDISALNIDATKAEISVASHNPVITVLTDLTATKASITVAGHDPQVAFIGDIYATKAGITVAGHNATVVSVVNIDATAGRVTVAGHNPTVVEGSAAFRDTAGNAIEDTGGTPIEDTTG